MLDRKLYYEYAKSAVYSPSFRRIVRGGALFLMILIFIVLVYVTYWQITRREFYIFKDSQELFMLYILPWALFSICLASFISSFFSHRLLVLDGRTGHKSEFFKNADSSQVNYCSAIDNESITIDKDGELENIGWNEVVGTYETKHLFLLVLNVTYVYKLKYPQFVKSNTQPVYVHNTVILGKKSFEQGSMEDLQALLKDKGIGKYDGSGDAEHVVYR